MGTLVQVPESLKGKNLVHGFEDDFYNLLDDGNSGSRYTLLDADAGSSVAASDAAGGVLVVTTGSTDNDEAGLWLSNETFLFADDKPIFFEIMLKYSEANTDDANVGFGLINAPAANVLIDDGSGLPTGSGSGMAIFKLDGETAWRTWAKNGTTIANELMSATNKNNLTSTVQTSASSAYKVFQIYFKPTASGKGDIDFIIDGSHVYKYFDFDTSSATEMAPFLAAKAGGGNSEVVNADYWGSYQKR